MIDPLEQLNRLETRWRHVLGQPDWYLTIAPELEAWRRHLHDAPEYVRTHAKSRLYAFFEERLRNGGIALGSERSADTERKAIDTVVVHHTSNPPGMGTVRLSAIELIRLYVPYYLSPTAESDRPLRGSPITSGHLRDGVPVFWPYHWIIRTDGRVERLLQDGEIGWHAGNWDTNCRSVAIVFDNDYAWSRPSATELRAAARLISREYGRVPRDRILGHQEVNQNTACPSRLFLDGPRGLGWKYDLFDYLSLRAAAA